MLQLKVRNQDHIISYQLNRKNYEIYHNNTTRYLTIGGKQSYDNVTTLTITKIAKEIVFFLTIL